MACSAEKKVLMIAVIWLLQVSLKCNAMSPMLSRHLLKSFN